MKNYRFIFFITCVLIISGCYPPQPQATLQPPLERLQIIKFATALSIENRPIEVTVLGNGPDVSMFIGTIHGSEPAGQTLVNSLCKFIQDNPQIAADKTIVLIPLANPDGLANNSRYNTRGVDLNRNFPAENRIDQPEFGQAALTEPESRAIMKILKKYPPDRVITIHQPLDCIDYDGPADDLAAAMAMYTELPVKKLGSRPGSLGSYVGLELARPIITVELKPDDHLLSESQLWENYGLSMVAAVTYPQPLEPYLTEAK